MRKEMMICQRLYEENGVRVRWFLASRFSDLSEDDVFDVMQEVWKTLAEHIDVVLKKDSDGQRAWLLTVARNKAYDKVRERQRELHLIERVQENDPMMRQKDASAQDIAVGRVIASAILEKLSCADRETLFGEYFNVSSEMETEKVTNAKTCKRYRARMKLKKYMEEGGLDE